MADELTATTQDALIPEVWAQRGLQVLRNNVVLGRLTTRDTDYGSFQRGDVINVSLPPAFTASDKTGGGVVTNQAHTDTTVTVTLDQHKEVTFLLEDAAKALSGQGIERYMDAAVAPLADAIEDDLLDLRTGFTTNTDVTTSGALTGAQIRGMQEELTVAKAPAAERFAILNPGLHYSIYDDATLDRYLAASQSEIKEGAVARLYGMDIYESTAAAISGAGIGFAGSPQATILATRALPTDGNGNGAMQTTVTDPESGFSIRSTIAYDSKSLGMQVTLDVLYGVAEGRDAFGIELKNA